MGVRQAGRQVICDYFFKFCNTSLGVSVPHLNPSSLLTVDFCAARFDLSYYLLWKLLCDQFPLSVTFHSLLQRF